MLLNWTFEQWAVALALIELPSMDVTGAKWVKNRFLDRYKHEPSPQAFMGVEKKKNLALAANLFSRLGADLMVTDENNRMVNPNEQVTIAGRLD